MANQQTHICRLPAVYSNFFPGVSQKIYRQRRGEELRRCEEKLVRVMYKECYTESKVLHRVKEGAGEEMCIID